MVDPKIPGYPPQPAPPGPLATPRSDDAYIVGKLMDLGTQIGEAITKANVRVAELDQESTKIRAQTEEKRIEADRFQSKERELTLRVVLPLCVIGLFAFLGYALHADVLNEAVAALPQLALLWKITPKRKPPGDGDE